MLVGRNCPVGSRHPYSFPALTFAHRARYAAAIFLRAAVDMVRLAGADPVAAFAGCDPFRV